jgi:NADH-quinone oxidoreductase subunit F
MSCGIAGRSMPHPLTNILPYGGYSAFEKALFDMTRDEIIDESDGIRTAGQGRRRFPGRTQVGSGEGQKEPQKYVVCNGDEGDPGAFMDRSIMEGDPHSVLEGMMIAGLCLRSGSGIYLCAGRISLGCQPP